LRCRTPLVPSHRTSADELYTLSLHDALPICQGCRECRRVPNRACLWSCRASAPAHLGQRCLERLRAIGLDQGHGPWDVGLRRPRDRKSTRLNSSHVKNSYAVFCLKKKKIKSL